MKRIFLTLLVNYFIVAQVGIGFAAENPPKIDPAAVAAVTHGGTGTLNSIDEKTGKVNISHDPITSLNWPAMTMNFQASDAGILKDLKPGTKVQFDVQKTADGYRLTKITPSSR